VAAEQPNDAQPEAPAAGRPPGSDPAPGRAGAGKPSPAGAAAAPGPPVPPKRATIPPAPTHRLRTWLLLLLGLLAVSPPLLIDFDRADATESAEQYALATAGSTWRMQAEEGGWAWLVPHHNGQPSVSTPPLSVWVNLLAWADLDPQAADPDRLLARSRLTAVAFALLALASTYWAGVSVGSIRVAIAALLAAGTSVIFVRQGRLAAPDTYLMGFVALSIAGGLWAMRPIKSSSGFDRRVVGWLICGLALAAAILVKGFHGVPLVVVPLACMALVSPYRRVGNVIGVLFAVSCAVLAAAPWFIYVIQQSEALGLEQPVDRLFADFPLLGRGLVAAESPQPVWHALGLLGLVFPWTIWLIGALVQPWARGKGQRRRQLLLGWSWFLAGFALLAGFGPRHPREMVALVPAIGVMVGQLWAFHMRLADEHERDPGVNWLRIPHWVMLGVGSILLPLFVLWPEPILTQLQRWFGEPDVIRPQLEGLGPAAAAVWALAMVGLTALGAWWHLRWRPRLALAMSSVWAIVLLTVFVYGFVRSFHGTAVERVPGRQVAQRLDDATLYTLAESAGGRALSPGFLFYVHRDVRPVPRDRLEALHAAGQPFYLIVPDTPAHREIARELDLEPVFRFDEMAGRPRRLYRHAPAEPPSDADRAPSPSS